MSATGSELESVASPNVPVSLSAVSGQPITVSYAVTGGTGASGINYTLAAGTLTFNPGIKTENIPLMILDDGVLASSKTVQITLSSPSNATLGTKGVFTYTIQPAGCPRWASTSRRRSCSPQPPIRRRPAILL